MKLLGEDHVRGLSLKGRCHAGDRSRWRGPITTSMIISKVAIARHLVRLLQGWRSLGLLLMMMMMSGRRMRMRRRLWHGHHGGPREKAGTVERLWLLLVIGTFTGAGCVGVGCHDDS